MWRFVKNNVIIRKNRAGFTNYHIMKWEGELLLAKVSAEIGRRQSGHFFKGAGEVATVIKS